MKIKPQIFYVFVIITFCIPIISCKNIASEKFAIASKRVSKNLSFQIIETADKSFGYDIFSASKLMIHQSIAPALSGNQGFKTKKQAQQVAELVIKKIISGVLPPTVTTEELNQLGIH